MQFFLASRGRDVVCTDSPTYARTSTQIVRLVNFLDLKFLLKFTPLRYVQFQHKLRSLTFIHNYSIKWVNGIISMY